MGFSEARTTLPEEGASHRMSEDIMGTLTKSLIGLALLGLSACHAEATAKAPNPPPACRDGFTDNVETAGRTVGAAAKTGAVAAADGVVQVSSATAGLVQDGKDGAKEKWKARAADTKQDARENAADTEREANRPNCR
jgi:hypothetical protein